MGVTVRRWRALRIVIGGACASVDRQTLRRPSARMSSLISFLFPLDFVAVSKVAKCWKLRSERKPCQCHDAVQPMAWEEERGGEGGEGGGGGWDDVYIPSMRFHADRGEW